MAGAWDASWPGSPGREPGNGDVATSLRARTWPQEARQQLLPVPRTAAKVSLNESLLGQWAARLFPPLLLAPPAGSYIDSLGSLLCPPGLETEDWVGVRPPGCYPRPTLRTTPSATQVCDDSSASWAQPQSQTGQSDKSRAAIRESVHGRRGHCFNPRPGATFIPLSSVS